MVTVWRRACSHAEGARVAKSRGASPQALAPLADMLPTVGGTRPRPRESWATCLRIPCLRIPGLRIPCLRIPGLPIPSRQDTAVRRACRRTAVKARAKGAAG